MNQGCYIIITMVMVINTGFPQGDQQDTYVRDSTKTDSSAFEFLDSYIPVSSFVSPAFPSLPQPLSLLSDTLTSPLGWIASNFGKREMEIYIDREWKTITFTEYLNDEIMKIPFTASMDWYVVKMMHVTRNVRFVTAMKSDKEGGVKPRQRQGIKFDLVDMGALGTASLRVRGNVNISGKMVFQDQELIRSNLNETQNTHLEFDQKQSLNVEGKIGDRITVLMDNDSERDFDWENNIRISYKGAEDDIVQKIDAGNISLSLPATQYVTFSGQNKGLFGLKAVSKLGPIDITTIASIEKTKKEQQQYKGTNEAQEIRIKDYNYVKNQYFFINEMYRNGVQNLATEYKGQEKIIQYIPPYYPLVNGLHRIGRYTIKNFELYKSVIAVDPTTDRGTAYVNIDSTSDLDKQGNFKRLERGPDFNISNDLGFIRLRSSAPKEVVYACSYIIVELDPNNRSTILDTVLSVGSGITNTDTLLSLQMIKVESPDPQKPLWDLMFKNVYFMGATNINEEGFEVSIWNNYLKPDKPYDPNGIQYITQFGMDSVNTSNEKIKDDIIDMSNANIVNMVTGEILFPTFHPFATDSLQGGNTNPELQAVLGGGSMYTSTLMTDWTQDQRWEILIKYANQSSTISLGFMIVEKSDQVFLDGVELKRGSDYQVDYFSGTLILNKEIAPESDLKILYEKHELVSFDKKTIMGTRAQMDFGKNSFLGMTALYYNQSIINEKVEVGYEPMRNFIWDMNGRYKHEFDGLTRAIDRLPFIETEKVSAFSIEGEIAQVLPNPNPINNEATGDGGGVAFIDDFEGAKRTTSIPIQRRYWKASSVPVLFGDKGSLSQKNRANLIWYNPYIQTRTKNIWPNQSTSLRAQNETTDILRLKYNPKRLQKDIGLPQDSLWAGIITSLYSGDFDQTESKFFEIWLKGETGIVSINLGKISEDWDGNGKLNTEDIPEANMNGNTLLDEGEDVGLDGCTDEYENGWGGCIDTFYAHVVNDPAWNDIVYTGSDKDLEDPNGDNWSYEENSSDYSKINGTENNALDGGKYPDTEDLNRTTFLDKVNDYFAKSFSLADTTYLAGRTKEKNGPYTGWKLYRIPLNHFSKIDTTKNSYWNEIQHLRLVISDTGKVDLSIAKIELVGNDWQEMGVASDSSRIFTKEDADSVFAVSVVNTEDNAEYTPPKGVKGEYDRINDIRSKEQSLVLKFSELPSNYSGAAIKSLMKKSGKNYLTYDKLKMYVYGETPSQWIGKEDTEVDFFIRFGQGNHYYNLSQPVYSGWDENRGRNSVEIDLNWLTRLKLQDTSSVNKYRESDIYEINNGERIYRFTDENGFETGKVIQIKGKPSLASLQYFIVGVSNKADGPISGEVWIDELRLSGVKKDKGVAMRVQSKFNLADLASSTISYSRKDADFHILQKRLGKDSNSEDFRMNMDLQVHKLMPKSWGVTIPVKTTFTKTENRPKYYPDSDILVNQEHVPDSIMSSSQTISFSTSLTKSGKSDNKLIKATLDRLKPSFNASRSQSSNSLNSQVLSEKYSGKLSYSYPFSRDNYFMPFTWIKSVKWIGDKIGDMHLFYTPTTFNTSINFSESLSQTTKRVGGRSPDNYNFGLGRNFSLDYNITNKLKTKYSTSATSDLRDYRGYAWMAIQELDPGVVENITENLKTSFNPKIFNWLKPTFTHTAAYRWNKSRASTIDGASIGTQLRFSSSVSILPSQIFEMFYKPTPKKANRSKGGRRRGRKRNKDSEKDEKNSVQKDNAFLTATHGWVKRVNQISLSYTENLNRTGQGVQGDIPNGYKFGWLPDHGGDYSESVGSNTGNWDHKRDFSIRTGINISRNLSTSINYAQNISTTISGSNSEQRTMARDYFAWGEKLEKFKIPFFGWSLRLSGIEKWPLIKRISRSASLEHAFSGKESRFWQFEDFDGSKMPLFELDNFINDYKEFQRSSRTNISFSPLIGMNFSFKKGISLNIRHSLSRSVEETPTGLSIQNERNYTASSNYSHRGGFTIPLLFTDDWNIQNTVNFTLNFDMNQSITKDSKDNGVSFAPRANNSSWKTSLRISYSFSSQISGGIIYEYRETKSLGTGKKVDRDFGFDVNIAISG